MCSFKPRSVWFLTLLFLLVLSTGLPASAAGKATLADQSQKTQHQLDQIKAQKKAAKKILKQQKRDFSRAQKKLRKTEIAISELKKTTQDTGQSIDTANGRLSEIHAEQRVLEQRKMQQLALLKRDLRVAHKVGSQGHVKLLLNAEHPQHVTRFLKYYNYFHAAHVDRVEALSQTLVALASQAAHAREKQVELEALQEKQQTQLNALQARKQDREKLLASIEKKVDTRQAELAKLQKQEHALAEVLVELQKLVAEQVDRQASVLAFGKRKGRMRWPVNGKVSTRFGSRRADGRMTWNGVLISTRNGEPVHAVHQGQVVFADWLRGYGLLVIVDHGDGYLSLYGHNEALYKTVGDWVDANEQVGVAGNTGGQRKTALYFEIRRHGKPINPSKWCRG